MLPGAIFLAAAAAAASAAGAEAPQHWWPKARGRLGKVGHTDRPGPKNLTAQFAWYWEHPEKAVVTGALIDSDRNVYVSHLTGITKLSSKGAVIWYYPHLFNNVVPVIEGNFIYGASLDGTLYALDLAQGRPIWMQKLGGQLEMDTPYVEVNDGVVITICERLPDKDNGAPGNRRVFAVNATNGNKLWDHLNDNVLWNFQPLFPNDGTFFVMDIHGGVHRYSVHEGYQKVVPPPNNEMLKYSFTDGGMTLSPDADLLYTCSNFLMGGTGTPGVLRAYRVDSVELLWQRFLPEPCVSWPASNGRVVVVPIGALPQSMPFYMNIKWLPVQMKIFTSFVANLLDRRQWLIFRNKAQPMSVHAFDPVTGENRWTYSGIEPWPRIASRSDEELLWERIFRGHHARPVCGPASWSAPTIGGDGTAYAAGMDGVLYGIRDADADGVISPDEVTQFDIGAASLHGGAAFAPGLMTHATCVGVWAFHT